MFAKVRLMLSLFLLRLQIEALGLNVWMRETAYHAITRYSFRTGLVLRAGDDDDDIDARIAAAVEEATSGLKAKNKELMGKVKKLQSGSEIDPAEVERLEAEVETLRAQVKDAQKEVKTLTTRAEKAEKDLAGESAHTQKLLIENGLAAALTANGVTDPNLHAAAAALFERTFKPAVTLDGENRVAKVGEKLLNDAVKEWAGSDQGKTFVSAPGNSGGGAGGGKGGGGAVNPWAKDSFDMTAQGKLYTENPTLAKSMAAEHGVTLQ